MNITEQTFDLMNSENPICVEIVQPYESVVDKSVYERNSGLTS